MAPTRRQAIIWTNDGLFTDAYMRHSASMSWPCHTVIDGLDSRCWQNLLYQLGHNLNLPTYFASPKAAYHEFIWMCPRCAVCVHNDVITVTDNPRLRLQYSDVKDVEQYTYPTLPGGMRSFTFSAKCKAALWNSYTPILYITLCISMNRGTYIALGTY